VGVGYAFFSLHTPLCMSWWGPIPGSVKLRLYISAWKFSGYFASGDWICIFLLSHTPLHVMSGALYLGL